MKHTPGPWTASDEPGAYDICVVEHEDWRKNWYVTVEGPKRAEPEPDARLIAAAPAMYEALEGLVDADFVDGQPPWAYISHLTGKFSCEYCGRVIEAETGWAMGHSDACPVAIAFSALAAASGEAS